MGKSGKIITAVIVVAVVAGGAFLLMNKKSDTPASTTSDGQSNSSAAAVTITYTDSGFSLSADTVESGDAVKIVNQSAEEISLNSDPHPVHTDNSELNVGDVEAGASKTFTLTTKGTWGFHNHYDHTKSGKITVE